MELSLTTSLNPDGRPSCTVFSRFFCGVSGSSVRPGIGEDETETEADRTEALLRFRLTPRDPDGDEVSSAACPNLEGVSAQELE